MLSTKTFLIDVISFIMQSVTIMNMAVSRTGTRTCAPRTHSRSRTARLDVVFKRYLNASEQAHHTHVYIPLCGCA